MAEGGGRIDIYQWLEREVRTPKRRLLIDAFLPPPDEIESEFTPAPEPEAPATSEPIGVVQEMREQDSTGIPVEREQRRQRRSKSRKKSQSDKSLQEEIDEFMNRDGNALAPDADL